MQIFVFGILFFLRNGVRNCSERKQTETVNYFPHNIKIMLPQFDGRGGTLTRQTGFNFGNNINSMQTVDFGGN